MGSNTLDRSEREGRRIMFDRVMYRERVRFVVFVYVCLQRDSFLTRWLWLDTSTLTARIQHCGVVHLYRLMYRERLSFVVLSTFASRTRWLWFDTSTLRARMQPW